MGRERERETYEALVRRHAADLYRFALHLAGDRDAAEDLVSETYFEAWRSIGRLADVESGKSWLLTIVKRRWMRLLERQDRRGAQEQQIEDFAELPGPDVKLPADPEIIRLALDSLDPRLKEAFLLVFLEGFTCAEVSAQIDVPLGTVLSRIHRARIQLRAFLTGLERDRGGGNAFGGRGSRPGEQA
jgi:RNA polymerase sigma-70 factor (ECF subfamily)